ncbi:hypothetical protein LDENG_00100780, partial [Lucifuga dentata]
VQLEEHGVDRLQGGRAAEPAGSPAWESDGLVWRWDSEPGCLLCPVQHRYAVTQPQEQRSNETCGQRSVSGCSSQHHTALPH